MHIFDNFVNIFFEDFRRQITIRITIKITIMLMIMIMKIIMIKMFNYPCPFHVNVYLNGAVQLQVY